MSVTVRAFREADRVALLALWEACGLVMPWNDPGKDLDRKLAVGDGGLLVLEEAGVAVGTVMVGYEGHRGWLNYLAVSPTHRRRGCGERLVRAAEDWLAERGCPKVNLQVRTANTAAARFYEAVGFRVDDCVSYGKRLIDDGPGDHESRAKS